MSTTLQQTNLKPSVSLYSNLTLEQAVDKYKQAIQAIIAADTKSSLELILEVLLVRDRIEIFLVSDEPNASVQTLIQVVELDTQLKKLSHIIASHKQLKSYRDSIHPPEKSWWWFFTPHTLLPPKPPRWASHDWLWHGLTVASLVLSVSFVTDTLKSLSQDGLDLLQTFGAIGQGAGLVLVSGGALTEKGKKIVTDALNTINVPSAYQSEVTFACSAAILATTYGINQSLPSLGEYYYNQGQKFYDKGRLLSAEEKFKEAMNFAPHDHRIGTALGNIYETLDRHKEAQSMYQGGFVAGYPEALNGMGRVFLRTATGYKDFLEAETSFRLALADPNMSNALRSEVHAHLGLTLIKQSATDGLAPERVKGLLETAAEHLKQSNEIDQTITENREPGLGMGYCYLAEVLEQQSKLQEATEQWELCAARAIPTSIGEYQDILVFGNGRLDGRLNLSQILSEDLTNARNGQ